MFAIILTSCSPSDPVTIWNGHGAQFVADIRNRHRGVSRRILEEDYVAKNYVFLEIQQFLESLPGGSLDSYGLPFPPNNLEPLKSNEGRNEHELEKLSVDAVEAIHNFNADQKMMFDTVLRAVLPGVSYNNLQTANQTIRDTGDEEREESEELAPRQSHRQQRLFFLDASGGTGKTFVTNAMLKFLESKGKKVIAVATSAVAAQLLRKGRTAHPHRMESVFEISHFEYRFHAMRTRHVRWR